MTYFFVVLAFVLVMIALVSLLDLGLGKARLPGLHRRRRHLIPPSGGSVKHSDN
ncbi:preprotein translocase subunit SecE [Nocardioides convexus]|uniref:preprotein translocase subunit SecE n=1 Tax=Nocardioides convexus TaxID=2712224 RepID=UPI0024188CD0|nr:preprotein translocase subunit SecE [Nocardioides convexus]